MKSFSASAIAACFMAVAALGLAGPVAAAPPMDEPQPGEEQVFEGDAAVMMMFKMMSECMYGGAPGIPRAVLRDRGVQFVCTR